jgi:hypothetical protein
MFLLWAFGDSVKTVITRGRTQEEAFIHASKNWNRGETITFYPFNPIWAGREYNKNHAPNWLNRPPYWLTHAK